MNSFANTNNLLMSLVVIPLLGSALCAIARALGRPRLAVTTVVPTLLGCGVVLALTWSRVAGGETLLIVAGGWEPVAGIVLGLDMVGWIVSALMFVVCTAAALFAIAERLYSPLFYVTFLIMVAGMNGVVLTQDLFNLFVFLEILAVAVYIQIAYLSKSHSVLAALRYLLIGSAAMVLYLVGVYLLYHYTGQLSCEALRQALEAGVLPRRGVAVALAALVTGVGVRTAFVPFHTWLPQAHAFAPHPVSAMLSGVMLKIAFIALWRIFTLAPSGTLGPLLCALGGVSALYGVVRALQADDIKLLLAWSSVSQMGFIVAALGLESTQAHGAALYHVVSHGLFKGLLFLCAGCIVWASGKRSLHDLEQVRIRLPLVHLCLAIAGLAIIGIPPFNGFVSKKLILASAQGNPLLYVMLWLAAVGTTTAYLRLGAALLPGMRGTVPPTPRPTPLPRMAMVPLGALAAACIATGLYPRFWTGLFLHAVSAGEAHQIMNVYSVAGIGESLAQVLPALLLVVLLRRFDPPARQTGRIGTWDTRLNVALCLVLAGFVLLAVAGMQWP